MEALDAEAGDRCRGVAMTDSEFFSGLLPEMAQLALLHRNACHAHGISIVFTAGWRSPAAQMALYEKGRVHTAAGWSVIHAHEVVTNATPEHAPHCRGAAYDCAPVVNERIDWNNLALFEAVAKFAPPGLTWGGVWPKLKDLPHYELPYWRGLPLKTGEVNP